MKMVLVGYGEYIVLTELTSITKIEDIKTYGRDDYDDDSDNEPDQFISYNCIKFNTENTRVISIRKYDWELINRDAEDINAELLKAFKRSCYFESLDEGIIVPDTCDINNFIYEFENESDMLLFVELYKTEFYSGNRDGEEERGY